MRNRSEAVRSPDAQGTVFSIFLVALVSAPALADARADAKRHFRQGMSLIAAGEVERGIAELQQAYAIKPHQDVLYDIAKAYLDLGNIPEALEYFRRYVASDPPDKDQVLAMMQRLEAAVGSAAVEPPAVQQTVPQAQTLDVQKLLTRLETLENQQQTSPAREIAAALSAGAREAPNGDIFEEPVVTASARSSSESKAPASLTVITGDEIRLSGAATIPEILRRVPGVDVAEMNPSDTNVSIRGFNRRLSNKVLVLLDGRSVYQDFLGGTFWPLVDVALQDVERIEVVRGPGSALYGSNAFAGVVNIITRTGEEVNGVHAYVRGGNHGTWQGGMTSGGKAGKLTYRTTFTYDRADKWTKDVADDRADLPVQFAPADRSREIQRADLAVSYDLGKARIVAGGGFDNVAMELVPPGALRTFGNTGQAGFARLEVESGATRVKAFWNALRLSSGPEYWPEGISSLRSSVRSDVLDLSAQTGFDFKLLGRHRLNVGAGYRFKSVQWSYLATRPDNTPYQEHHFNAFLQEEWEMSRQVSLVLSWRVDRHPLLAGQDVTAGGLVHSPRGTLLYEISPEQVFRLTVGSAFRAPTFLESYIDLFAPIPNQPAIGVRFQGSKTLRPEQLVQAEVGFRGHAGNFRPDVVVYAERVQNLITDGALRLPANPAEAVEPKSGQYVAGYTGFQNEPGSYFGVGAELGGTWSPADGVDLGANYSHERMFACRVNSQPGCTGAVSAANQVSATLGNTARHKLNLNAAWRTRANVDLSVDLHHVSAVTWSEKSFDVTREGGVAFTPYTVPAYTLVNGRVGYRWVKDRLETGVAFYNLLGDDHREHPFGNQIGRRVLFTVSGAF